MSTSEVRQPDAPIASNELTHTLEETGYVIMPDILTEAECDMLSVLLDEIWTKGNFGELYDDEPGVRFVPNALQHSAIFQRCIDDPGVLAAVRTVIGPDVRLNLINGRRPDPGSGNQPLHDLTRRRGRPFMKVNTIWCLDEFTPVNGSTRVLLGTHIDDTEALERIVNPMLPHPDEVHAVAARGSVIVHNSHLIHGGSLNESDGPRRSIQSAYTRPDVPTHYDWTELPEVVRDSLRPTTLALLGLD